MTAVSFLSGVNDGQASAWWARADGPEPNDSAEARLLAAHRIRSAISTAENGHVARNWFVGSNPRLGDRSPLEGLRDGDIELVLAARLVFFDGTDG